MISDHELNEVVSKLLKYKQQAVHSNPETVAVDAAHGVAFHRGLGASITPSQSSPYEKYVSGDALAEFAQNAYSKSNIALVAMMSISISVKLPIVIEGSVWVERGIGTDG